MWHGPHGSPAPPLPPDGIRYLDMSHETLTRHQVTVSHPNEGQGQLTLTIEQYDMRLGFLPPETPSQPTPPDKRLMNRFRRRFRIIQGAPHPGVWFVYWGAEEGPGLPTAPAEWASAPIRQYPLPQINEPPHNLQTYIQMAQQQAQQGQLPATPQQQPSLPNGTPNQSSPQPAFMPSGPPGGSAPPGMPSMTLQQAQQVLNVVRMAQARGENVSPQMMQAYMIARNMLLQTSMASGGQLPQQQQAQPSQPQMPNQTQAQPPQMPSTPMAQPQMPGGSNMLGAGPTPPISAMGRGITPFPTPGAQSQPPANLAMRPGSQPPNATPGGPGGPPTQPPQMQMGRPPLPPGMPNPAAAMAAQQQIGIGMSGPSKVLSPPKQHQRPPGPMPGGPGAVPPHPRSGVLSKANLQHGPQGAPQPPPQHMVDPDLVSGGVELDFLDRLESTQLAEFRYKQNHAYLDWIFAAWTQRDLLEDWAAARFVDSDSNAQEARGDKDKETTTMLTNGSSKKSDKLPAWATADPEIRRAKATERAEAIRGKIRKWSEEETSSAKRHEQRLKSIAGGGGTAKPLPTPILPSIQPEPAVLSADVLGDVLEDDALRAETPDDEVLGEGPAEGEEPMEGEASIEGKAPTDNVPTEAMQAEGEGDLSNVQGEEDLSKGQDEEDFSEEQGEEDLSKEHLAIAAEALHEGTVEEALPVIAAVEGGSPVEA